MTRIYVIHFVSRPVAPVLRARIPEMAPPFPKALLSLETYVSQARSPSRLLLPQVVELVAQFRQKGHLVAELDPLRRPGQSGRGPYFHESNQYVWPDATYLLDLVENYPAGAPLDARAQYLSERLGLKGNLPADHPWFVNGTVKRPTDESLLPGKDLWLLPDLFEFMARSYWCVSIACCLQILHPALASASLSPHLRKVHHSPPRLQWDVDSGDHASAHERAAGVDGAGA